MMSNSAAAEEPPHKRRKMSPCPSSSLPDDLVLSWLARVSKSDHAALSLVSKSHRALVASPDLHRMRSLLGCAENWLYVCLATPPDPTPRWFILHRGKSVDRLLRPIASLRFQPPEASSVVAVDWGIYVIGGRVKGKLSRGVHLLDCRTHRWRRAPSMGIARAAAAAGVVGGKIYVFGGCRDFDSSNWAEVFDPKTQTWDSLPAIPDPTVRCQYMTGSVVVEEKMYAMYGVDDSFYYSPRESKWGRGNIPPRTRNRRDWCFIDKVIYCIDNRGHLCWCEPVQLESSDPEGMYWREVKGLGSLNESLSRSRLVHFDSQFEAICETGDQNLVDLLPGARLSNFGGNLVLFWDVVEGDDHHLGVWCAEISLERRPQGPEIWGNIEWSNAVMTVDRHKGPDHKELSSMLHKALEGVIMMETFPKTTADVFDFLHWCLNLEAVSLILTLVRSQSYDNLVGMVLVNIGSESRSLMIDPLTEDGGCEDGSFMVTCMPCRHEITHPTITGEWTKPNINELSGSSAFFWAFEVGKSVGFEVAPAPFLSVTFEGKLETNGKVEQGKGDNVSVKFGSHGEAPKKTEEKTNKNVLISDVPKDAAEEWPAAKQIHSFYFVKNRHYEDPKIKAKLEAADKELEKLN
ncbi:unnamed protein product [Microthlaspi erraticum]|uniref:FKB95-like N-terminal Kelch domain-containing protein n=1 Tax=Microthlaspi erraticum TaxID=1685480 RepID=A0A6D2JSP8_9BRAS|nr:unnamed protein product [Microthlaspi erraticum]